MYYEQQKEILVLVMVVALKVVVEICLTNEHINSVTLLVTSGLLAEFRCNMKRLPAVCGWCVGNVGYSTVRGHSVCPFVRQRPRNDFVSCLVFGTQNG